MDNQITNTKYTAISFIPKTLAEQFRYALIPSFSRVSGPAEEVVPVRCLPRGASSHLVSVDAVLTPCFCAFCFLARWRRGLPSTVWSPTLSYYLSCLPHSRNMNRYFLLIACLQLISTITPVSPVTTWAPLIIIFSITAIKELVDDLGRRKADKLANSREYTVLRKGKRTLVSTARM